MIGSGILREQLQGGKISAKSAGDGSGRVNHHPGGGGGK